MATEQMCDRRLSVAEMWPHWDLAGGRACQWRLNTNAVGCLSSTALSTRSLHEIVCRGSEKGDSTVSSTTPTPLPRVALLMPPLRRDAVFTADVLARLARCADVVIPDGDTTRLAQQLADLLPTVDACLTSWGAPPLPVDLLTQSPRLRIIAHAAGSIKGLIPIEALQRGIVVCHAADIIADAVAECTILLMLTGLRQLHMCDRALKDRQTWQEAAGLVTGHRLAGCTVGLVGCGKVARRLIRLLQPFGVTLRVYDPYLTGDEAASLGVTSATLDDVFKQSTIVSNHAPITPDTRHLIGPHEFALLQDNALFINTARAWTVDEAALLAEVQSGRIWAALDVFEAEPLPCDSVWRELPNVFVTPHQAGATVETHREQGLAMVKDLERFFRGEPVHHRVLPETYPLLA